MRAPTQYELDKLARMTRENAAELEAIKAQIAAGVQDQGRVRKLQRRVKEQARLEKSIARRSRQ